MTDCLSRLPKWGGGNGARRDALARPIEKRKNFPKGPPLSISADASFLGILAQLSNVPTLVKFLAKCPSTKILIFPNYAQGLQSACRSASVRAGCGAGFVIVPKGRNIFLVGRFLMGPGQAGVEHVFLGELELPLPRRNCLLTESIPGASFHEFLITEL